MNTINLINDTSTIQLSSFDNHIRSKGVNEEGVVYFACLKWLDVGSRQKVEFQHFPSSTTCEKIGVAVRRLDSVNIRISIVWVSFFVIFVEKNDSHSGGPHRHHPQRDQELRVWV